MSKRLRTPAVNPIFRYRDECMSAGADDTTGAREMTDTFRNKMMPTNPSAAIAVSLERYHDKKVSATLEKHLNRDNREFHFEG